MVRSKKGWAGVAVLAAIALFGVRAHATDGVVGPGNCNENGFRSVLSSVDGSGGGTITFDCGTATIAISSYQTVAHSVVVDGGGRITFDGGGTSAFLQIYASGNLTLRGLTLQHFVFNASHALENFGMLTLDTVRMLSNTSTETPVANYNIADVVDSTFTGNAASSPTTGEGGAIGHSGISLTVSGSTFNGNSATYGAAIYSSGDLSVTNSTFVGNTGATGGGSIYQVNSGNAALDFLTIAGNSAPFGSGLYADGSGTMLVHASILSGNAGGNCDGVIMSSGYNLSSDMNCGSAFVGTGDMNDVTLNMDPLGDNGGPTETEPPTTGNPAINHVPTGACDVAFDQRGAARPFGGACDSGAVEVGAAPDDEIFANGFDPG